MLAKLAYRAERSAVAHVIPLGDEDLAGQVVVPGPAVRGGERLIRLGPVPGRAFAEPPQPLRDVGGARTGSPPDPAGEPARAGRPRAYVIHVTQPGQARVTEPVQFQQAVQQEPVALIAELEGAGLGTGQVERQRAGAVRTGAGRPAGSGGSPTGLTNRPAHRNSLPTLASVKLTEPAGPVPTATKP